MMHVKIRTEAAQFFFWEYINGLHDKDCTWTDTMKQGCPTPSLSWGCTCWFRRSGHTRSRQDSSGCQSNTPELFLLKGAQEWEFRSLGFSWFLHHEVSTLGVNIIYKKKYLGSIWGRKIPCAYAQSNFKERSPFKKCWAYASGTNAYPENTHQFLTHFFAQHRRKNSKFEKGLQNMLIMRIRNWYVHWACASGTNASVRVRN